jgi:mannan endo-1,4-beta-mannosidase
VLGLLNAYYLQEEAARGRLDVVDETFASALRLGARLIRTWAFNDDPAKRDTQIQRAKLDYSEVGLVGLDRVLARARHHGVQLILPLVNHWNAYGGARQWLLWNGVTDACEGDARFFTDARVRDHFAEHVARLLDRRNTLTGVRYADDPGVYAWELMNEPRGRGLDGEGRALAEWVWFAARVVKSAAPGQRVSVGDEGEQVSFAGHDERFWRSVGGASLFSPRTGTSFSRHLECPDVDLASCHFYPEKYGIRPGAELEAGIAWIEEHASLATQAGKPLVFGEFGVRERPERAEWYARWIAAARVKGVAAAGPWLFAYDERPCEWDEFTLYAGSPEAKNLFG